MSASPRIRRSSVNGRYVELGATRLQTNISPVTAPQVATAGAGAVLTRDTHADPSDPHGMAHRVRSIKIGKLADIGLWEPSRSGSWPSWCSRRASHVGHHR